LGSDQPITIVQELSEWAKDNNVIKRSRIPAEKKVLATILCASGHTSRDVSRLLGGMSHVAVHDANRSIMNAMPPLDKKRRMVSIEENVAYLNSETQGVIWLARDSDTGEILSFRCSLTRSSEDGKKFVESVLAFCTERPLLRIGRGPNFPNSLRNLDLYFQIETTSNFRQRISRFFLGSTPKP
jgi:putative transposase